MSTVEGSDEREIREQYTLDDARGVSFQKNAESPYFCLIQSIYSISSVATNNFNFMPAGRYRCNHNQ
jgi:hypothetical protein